MENQSDQPNQNSNEKANDLQSPERKVIRRRFVQSTLFPLKSHDNKAEISVQEEVKKDERIDGDDEIGGGKRRGGRKGSVNKKRGKKVNDGKVENCGEKVVEEIENVDDDDVEEICGSQGSSKKKRVRKVKGNSMPTNVDDDVEEICGSQENGKRKRVRKVKGNSTPTKQRLKKSAASGKDTFVEASDDTEPPDDGSPQQLTPKRRAVRNGRTNGNKAISLSKVLTQPVANKQTSQPVPDLWLEAKKTAEENSRIFAGKQIHPFFSSRKAGKKDLETIDLENNGYLDKKKERNVELGPVHVFEHVKDDSDSINWCNWTFDDEIFSEICNRKTKVSSFEGTIGSSNIDDILSASNPPITSSLLKDSSLAQLHGANEDSSVVLTSISPIVVEELTPYHPLKNIEKNLEVSEASNFDRGVPVSSHFDQENERVIPYYFNRDNCPENSLWTNKYHPEKALEVCGNSDAVKFINDWLQLWHETDFRITKSSYSTDKNSMKDDEYDSFDSDSYSENAEASGLKNVLLVTGPVGSGKSAAIYACAREQGFQVIEVNASDWRNGALLKQKFGEAVGSHWLKRSQESPIGKLNFKSSPEFTTNGAPTQDLNNSGGEVISLLEEEDNVGLIGSQNHCNGGLSCAKGDIKTLILFEDVDVNLCDDRGLISTIQQLADTGKRPMILTSNNESPLLPDNLDREEVCFKMPSQKELTHYMQRVCCAEKSNIQPDLIERCVKFCSGDIRKTLMLIQFWCQSNKSIKDGKMQSISCPVMFNLEAGHCILPKLIPWELPSLLSEFVEAEVAKSSSKMEENHSLLGVIKEEEVDNTSIDNKLDFDICETASIEAKKEAILSGNFIHVDEDLLAGGNTCVLSNSSGSPVAFTRRNIHRKLGTVLSDSEDEVCNHEAPAVSVGLFNDVDNAQIPAVHSQSPVFHLALEGMSNEFGDQLCHPAALEVGAARQHLSETALVNNIDFFALSDSHNQSTVPFVLSSEANYRHLEFDHTSFSSCREAHDSSNLLNHLLVHNGDGNFLANMSLSPVMNHDSMNQLEDQPYNFGEAIGVEIGRENAANLCLNSLTDGVMVGSPRNHSTDKLNQCAEDSVAKHQHLPLENENVNHGGLVAADASFNQVFDQLLCYSNPNMQSREQQCQEIVEANPLGYKSLSDSCNPSSGQLFHFVEAKEKEIQQQHTEVNNSNHYNCVAVDVSLNQLGGHFLGTENPEKSQKQLPENADANNASCLQLDDSLKLMMEQPCVEGKTESIQHQLPDVGIVDLKGYSEIGNSLNPLNENLLTFFETKTEHQCQNSDATYANDLNDQCQSVDMSYVPESTFVPETEVNEGTECPSGTDLMEIVSPITVGNVDPFTFACEPSDYRFCVIDLNVNARDEEMGDSQGEKDHLEPSTSGCPVMDECSRMDFCKSFKTLRSSDAINPVQERWNELRLTDLRQFLISEHENAIQLLELGCRMSNLLSDTDLLLHDCEFLINDSSGQEIGLSEETYAFGWHDQQLETAFAIGQYGYFLYAKDIYALQPKMNLAHKFHLGWEMLVSTSNSIALGKLLSLNTSQIPPTDLNIKRAAAPMDASFTRGRGLCLQNIVESVLPLRSFLTVRGNALHDYLSSLAHISKSESSRLANLSAKKTKRRRVRVAKNYLTSGALNLSEDDLLKLNEYDSYRKDSSNLTH